MPPRLANEHLSYVVNPCGSTTYGELCSEDDIALAAPIMVSSPETSPGTMPSESRYPDSSSTHTGRRETEPHRRWLVMLICLPLAALCLWQANPAKLWARWMGDSRPAVTQPGTPTPTAKQPVTEQHFVEQLHTRPIRDIQVGERVLGRNPDRSEVDENLPDIDPKTWRHLRLRAKKATGKQLEVELLRPLAWVEQSGAMAGGTVTLNLPEFGAVGDMDVMSLGPCPEIKAGPGNVVTGKFIHESDGNIVNLKLEDQEEDTGVTSNHPYWSVDREEFIPVSKLRSGEQVNTLHGCTRVVSVTPQPKDELVYNLEIHGEHVYRVGSLGTLVHNICGDDFVRIRPGQQQANKGDRVFELTEAEMKFVKELSESKPNLQIFRSEQKSAGAGDFVIIDLTNKKKPVGWVVDLKAPGKAAHESSYQLRNAKEAAKLFKLTKFKTQEASPSELLELLKIGRRAWN